MDPSQVPQRVLTAELAAALCLATDLGMGLPLEYGLKSTLVAVRLADRLGLDAATRAARPTTSTCCSTAAAPSTPRSRSRTSRRVPSTTSSR